MMSDYYDRQGAPLSLEGWCALLRDHDYRRVALDYIGDVKVSTVWLGLDHNYFGDGPPLIFETMVFGGPMDQDPYRWSTEEEAKAGHDMAVDAVRLQIHTDTPIPHPEESTKHES